MSASRISIGAHTALFIAAVAIGHSAFAVCITAVALAAALMRPAAAATWRSVGAGLLIAMALLGFCATRTALDPTLALIGQTVAGFVLFAAGWLELAHARVRRAWIQAALVPTLLTGVAIVVPDPARPWLLLAAAAIRFGVLPLHTWVPVVVAEAPMSVSAPLIAAQLGWLTVPAMSPAIAPIALGFGLAMAVLAALGALVRRDAKRVLAFMVLSQGGTLLVAALCEGPGVHAGAQLLAASGGVALAGLLIILDAIERRLARRVGADVSGLSRDGRWFAVLALFFAAGAIALPGTPGFIAEDLLMDGLLEQRPIAAILLAGATVLTAIAVFRMVLLGFFGRSRGGTMPSDALIRERFALGFLVVVMLALSLMHPAVVGVAHDALGLSF